MKKKFMLLALIVLGSVSAFAEETPVLELKQTVVTSDSFGTSVRETTKNMTVVNAKEIKEKGAKTIADALRGVPGVVVREMDGSSPTIDLRGSGATAQFNTVILLDGVPVSGLAGFNLNTVPIEEIEKIIAKYFQNFKTYKETIKIDFENPLSVLRHLKYTGVTGFQRAPFSKIKSFKDNCLTYEVAYFICQK